MAKKFQRHNHSNVANLPTAPSSLTLTACHASVQTNSSILFVFVWHIFRFRTVSFFIITKNGVRFVGYVIAFGCGAAAAVGFKKALESSFGSVHPLLSPLQQRSSLWTNRILLLEEKQNEECLCCRRVIIVNRSEKHSCIYGRIWEALKAASFVCRSCFSKNDEDETRRHPCYWTLLLPMRRWHDRCFVRLVDSGSHLAPGVGVSRATQYEVITKGMAHNSKFKLPSVPSRVEQD